MLRRSSISSPTCRYRRAIVSRPGRGVTSLRQRARGIRSSMASGASITGPGDEKQTSNCRAARGAEHLRSQPTRATSRVTRRAGLGGLVPSSSSRSPGPKPGRLGSPDRSRFTPCSIQLRLDDARLDHQLAVAGDRARDPVDVRRLEQLDLTQRVAVEAAELERRLARLLERRQGLRPLPCAPFDRPGRACWRAGRARSRTLRRLSGWWPRSSRLPLAGSRVARPEGGRGVEARRDRAAFVAAAAGRSVRTRRIGIVVESDARVGGRLARAPAGRVTCPTPRDEPGRAAGRTPS